MDVLEQARETMLLLLTMPFGPGWGELLFRFVPFVLFLELPVYLLILLGALRHALRRDFATPRACTQFPRVSCLVTLRVRIISGATILVAPEIVLDGDGKQQEQEKEVS